MAGCYVMVPDLKRKNKAPEHHERTKGLITMITKNY
jgi:hypothetical protein